SGVHKAFVTASLVTHTGKKAVVITHDEPSAVSLKNDLTAMGLNALLFHTRDYNTTRMTGYSKEYEHKRIDTLSRVLDGAFDVVVMPIDAAVQYTVPPEILSENIITVTGADILDIQQFCDALVCAGYVRSDLCEGVGQFAVRGGIIDVFATGSENPVRIELWGDEVDSLAFFDIESQRRTDNVDVIKISPANEILTPDTPEFIEMLERFHSEIHGKGSVKARAAVAKDIERLKAGIRLASTDKYMPLLYDVASIFDYAQGYTLISCESFSVKERFKAAEGLMNEAIKAMFEEGELCPGLDRFSLRFPDLLSYYEKMGVIYMDNLPRGSFDTPVKELIGISARQIPSWNGSISVLEDDLRALSAMKERTCVIFAGTPKAADALCGDLEKDGFNAIFMSDIPSELPVGAITVLPGSISAGFEYPLPKITVLSHAGRTAVTARKKTAKKTAHSFHSLDELQRGNYVVHIAHGIGVFEGIHKLEAGGTIKDYIKIRYDKGDILYVPVTQLDQVSKYIGPSGDDKPVRLNRLG
ncbi:MAG: transcription-repair coupling factor, partial [Clostridia bacterium]|nr:transcription-repair coupling factor [Clostridia bacterium]